MNLKNKIETALSNDINEVLKLCSETASEFDYKIYIIGGVVRDLILERDIYDVDITVEGDAIEFCHYLVHKGFCKIIQVQNDLKTVKTIFENDIEIDFASTRQEFYPRRGHLPVVTRIGCTLQEDVYRRDFTINSIALSLNKENFGEVIDYTNGLEDIENKKIRILHDNSFCEDPSRIIRCLKFAARLNFHREKHTKELHKDYINTKLHDDISWSRIKSELKQTFKMNLPRTYDMYIANDIYKLIYGEKTELKGLEIKNLIDKYNPELDWLVYLGTTLKNKNIIDYFCFNRNEKKVFTDIDFLLNNSLSLFNSNYDIYKFFNKRNLEAILVCYLLTKRKEPLIYLEKLMNIRVELNGDELKELGIQDGREIGKLLDEILKRKLSGSLVNKEDEINFVNSKINS